MIYNISSSYCHLCQTKSVKLPTINLNSKSSKNKSLNLMSDKYVRANN